MLSLPVVPSLDRLKKYVVKACTKVKCAKPLTMSKMTGKTRGLLARLLERSSSFKQPPPPPPSLGVGHLVLY